MSRITAMATDMTLGEVAGQQVVMSYGNDAAARLAFAEGAVVVNRSHWGLLRLTGSTRHTFLHNQTTNDFKRLRAGEGRQTVFVTSTARVIDLALALESGEATWLVVSPERRATLLEWMPRFVFFMDDVQFHDASERHALFSLLGPTSGTLLTQLGAGAIVGEPLGRHEPLAVAGVEGRAVVGGGLPGEGYTLIVPNEGADAVWQALRAAGAAPAGEAVWESLRIEHGRPAADREITEEHNPLELGLWEAVSFTKGCYIGQEIIARLDTYQKLKQQLWGLRLSAPVQPATPVTVEGSEVGRVTSATETPQGPFALAFVRTKAGGAGLAVQVGEAQGSVVELPFLTRGRRDL